MTLHSAQNLDTILDMRRIASGKIRGQKKNGRVCTKCLKFKRAKDFGLNGRTPSGEPRLRSVCKTCGSRHKTEETAAAKTCRDCGKVKPISEFREHGISSYCRQCGNERSYTYKAGEGREKHNARMRQYCRNKQRNDPEYRKKNRARAALRYAVLTGRIQRPSHCSLCGKKCRVQAHHHRGYEFDHRYDVQWVCGSCHYKIDKEEG